MARCRCAGHPWSVRLGAPAAAHLRAHGEDARYRAMRESHGPGWERRSFWMVFMLQALVLWIVASPVHVVLAAARQELSSSSSSLSVLLFAAGFVLESLADGALAPFPARSRQSRTTAHDRRLRLVASPQLFRGEPAVVGVGAPRLRPQRQLDWPCSARRSSIFCL